MGSAVERISVLEERIDNTEEKLGDVASNIKSIADDVSEMKQMLAGYRGASSVIRYVTHAVSGAVGAGLTFMSLKH